MPARPNSRVELSFLYPTCPVCRWLMAAKIFGPPRKRSRCVSGLAFAEPFASRLRALPDAPFVPPTFPR